MKRSVGEKRRHNWSRWAADMAAFRDCCNGLSEIYLVYPEVLVSAVMSGNALGRTFLINICRLLRRMNTADPPVLCLICEHALVARTALPRAFLIQLMFNFDFFEAKNSDRIVLSPVCVTCTEGDPDVIFDAAARLMGGQFVQPKHS
jgi:hypothetical protein